MCMHDACKGRRRPSCANPGRQWGPGSTQLTSRLTDDRSRRPERRLATRARGQPIRAGSAHGTRTTVDGIAVFPDLSVSHDHDDFRLRASAPDRPELGSVLSDLFEIED